MNQGWMGRFESALEREFFAALHGAARQNRAPRVVFVADAGPPAAKLERAGKATGRVLLERAKALSAFYPEPRVAFRRATPAAAPRVRVSPARPSQRPTARPAARPPQRAGQLEAMIAAFSD